MYLRDQLAKKSQSLMNLYTNGFEDDTVVNLFDKIEKEKMQKRIDLLTEENNILHKNYNILKNKYTEVGNIVKTRSKDFGLTYEKMKSAQIELTTLERRFLELKDNKEKIQGKYYEKELQANKFEQECSEYSSRMN